MAESCMKVRFTQLGSLQFLSTNILQSSVATRLRCGGIFNYCFSRSLLLSQSVKKFWKLV